MTTTDNITKPVTKWNASLYDEKHAFVFKYGEDLVNLLNPQPGERILDLGCGTGYLADLIAQSGASVTGIDNSADMIEKARAAYPGTTFDVLSATDFHFEEPFDAIFSNAALHWVLDKQSAVDRIYENLKTKGRLVLEMGGKNNVNAIVNASRKVLGAHGFTENANFNIWYFPSLSEYTTLLEQKGFRVTYAAHYDRETELKDTENGIKDWIKMFGSSFLKGIPEHQLDEILTEIQDLLRPSLYRDNKWLADYKRLRIAAIKQ